MEVARQLARCSDFDAAGGGPDAHDAALPALVPGVYHILFLDSLKEPRDTFVDSSMHVLVEVRSERWSEEKDTQECDPARQQQTARGETPIRRVMRS